MGDPKCEVCGKECNWQSGLIDYTVVNLDVHKKCLEKLNVLDLNEIAVQKEKIDFLIKHFKHSVEKKLHVDNQEIIELLEDLKK